MNRIFKQLAAVLLALVLLAGTALAALPDRLIPGGQAIGLQLQTDGVSIVELAQDNPCAREAGLRRGDVIRAIDGERVSTVRQVTAAVSASDGQALTIRYERGGKAADTAVQPQRTVDGWRLGVFVRDSITGIGTVTYYDPDTNTFGALGHGITDGDTAALMPFGNGAILPSTVKAVKKGSCGSAGELRGEFDLTEELGQLYANTGCGIFGTLNAACSLAEGEALPVGDAAEGPAVIRSNISGDKVQEYAVEILKTIPDAPDGRELVISVTDPELIAATGGIVQGMSGSPILQNGQLVGAVTHVLLSDPTKGYGISVETMLNTGAMT